MSLHDLKRGTVLGRRKSPFSEALPSKGLENGSFYPKPRCGMHQHTVVNPPPSIRGDPGAPPLSPPIR